MGAQVAGSTHRTPSKTQWEGEAVSDYGYPHASDEVQEERNRIADRAYEELRRAGLPAHRWKRDADGSPGAEIAVDPGEDSVGGVIVTWTADFGPALAESLLSGDLQAPVIRQNGAVARHMQEAIIGILRAAGLEAAPSEDDMNPLAVRVAST
ncbi:hypothetical protein SAM23877_2454 [Streptomyces ambofaciens ATCC 23877]|uniref:Uncharacterized protein n=1 Tax=Streptomyces ambofaciens (strain ATCC 23877 / 3486 / DSM 40053 / JCM 4204 / NBRC 12836 / NRRL B-2516) TaxID=278992 RepID=A0A0K2AR81_STRA7|nr:hypothetical protein SAM23877_2454 [Streptomyces ambofaciens ATCC 23877]